MTIEASFIIPLTLMLYFVIIYFGFYLYNQCITSQSCYIAALRGSQISRLSNSDLKRVVEEELSELLDKQVFVQTKDYKVTVNALEIEVNAQSSINLILQNQEFCDEEVLTTEKNRKIKKWNPALFIRECQRMQ